LQDEFSNISDFADFLPVHLALPIGGVLAERNIFSPLFLFVKMSPVNLAVASGNGNMFFTQKLHVQMANIHRSPQSQTKTQPWPSL
jgi:hypothetical protein